MSYDEQHAADECAACREYERERVSLTERLAVLDGWVRDIRRWLETQPGATEFDGSPLDGILRVMKHKDARVAEAEDRLRVYEPEPGKCEHGVAEGDWCEPCNRAYKEAAAEAAKEGRE